MWNGFATASELDRERFAREMKVPPATTQYVMYFTPRSGSSWLTDIADRTRKLSIPGECFNPNFMPNMTRALNATNMEEYIDILVRRRNTKGVFGFQITYHQLNAVFRSREKFLSHFPSEKCFWLIREDILLQAISLHKMQMTQLSHAPQITDEDLEAKDKSFQYDAKQIKRWLEHIRSAEISTEELFADHGLTPYRMSYEQNTSLRPARIVNAMGHFLGLEHMTGLKLNTAHRKIGTSTNDHYADRFRSEMSDYMEKIDEARAPMLAKIKRISQQGA